MSYHQNFDRLGNQVPAKADWQHRLIQRAGVVSMVACLFILTWGR